MSWKIFEEWKKVYEDSDFDARMNPKEPDAYSIKIKEVDDFLHFAHGCIKDIAEQNRDYARKTLDALFPYAFNNEKIIGTNLTYDSVIAVATKIHLNSEDGFYNSRIGELTEKIDKLEEMIINPLNSK